MADRGRDLKFSILSDADRFDLAGPADDLEDVGDAAKKMGAQVDDGTQELKRLALQGRDAQRELDRMQGGLDDTGDEAAQTARKVDSAFEKISSSSKSNLRRVGDDADHGMRRAGEATETFRDEARSNISEVASSFTGDLDSAVDVVQGTLGGVVGDMGLIGGVVGAGAATAVGFLYQRFQDVRQAVNDLARDLIETGRGLGADDIFGRIADAAVDDRTKVRELVNAAKELGIAQGDVAVAFSGSSRDILDYVDQLEVLKTATDGVKVATEEQVRAVANPYGATYTKTVRGQADAVSDLQDTLRGYADQARKAEEVQRLFEDATGVSLDTIQSYQGAIEDLAGSNDDLADATESAARRQAKATKSTKDTWEDYRDTAVASIDDVIDAQERDIKAAANFQANSEAVFAAVGQAGVDWALAQGENADKAMQLLANAPAKKQAEVVANYQKLGQQSGLQLAQGLTSARPQVGHSAGLLHGRAADVLRQAVNIPVGLDGPSSRDVANLRASMAARIGTLVVPVKAGQTRYSNTADNSKYRW